MIDVIGMDYNTALEKLSAAGYKVNCTTTMSTKPPKDDTREKQGVYEDIVVRQKEIDNNTVLIVINNMRIKN